MSHKTVWLEIDKSNQAIISYFIEQPTGTSDKVDYVQATLDELTYLNALEDSVLPPGMVVTLSDLQAHRARVASAKKDKTAPTIEPASKVSQQPSKGDSERSTTNPKTNNDKAKASLISALRKHRSRK
ncbi:hypothetical protein [Pseudomonas sp. C2B4]|uniref:hypothetical protein n=1 Tax=Pseudomonas sp. C2B4 TaxID=2735270 RepID=UPI001586CA40|nr:hypothetical protein [Pseudomonas sp. C2B4]NUU34754.1 hypothetical protein [Pseudomonas sp. C2B4]